MKLKEIKSIRATIVLKSGLHIGAGNDEIRIGGIDNPVLKNPVTGHPYIPGSSLKGKIRTLLEWSRGEIGKDGKPFSTDDSQNLVVRIFGNGSIDDNYAGGPTRVSFSDCELLNAFELIERKALTEAKAEVSMNRLTGTAKNGGLRHTERVPAGARFQFQITFKVFDMEDNGKRDEEAFDLLKEGLRLLELDSLGGSGSRGYGKIAFEALQVDTVWPTEQK